MSSMNTYDTYMQSYQKAMAPAIDYLQRSEAAKTIGLDYSKLTPGQINQYFGSTPQYATQSKTSALQNLAMQANGGQNPYLQGLQNSQPYGQSGQMSYAQSYPQLPAYTPSNQSYSQPYTQPYGSTLPINSNFMQNQMMPMQTSTYPFQSAPAPQYPQYMNSPSAGYTPLLMPFQGYQPQVAPMPFGYIPYASAAMPMPMSMMYPPPVYRGPVPYQQIQYPPVYTFIPPTPMFV